MAGVEVKTFDKADEVNNNFNNAKIEAVKVGNQRVMKLTLQPGWQTMATGRVDGLRSRI